MNAFVPIVLLLLCTHSATAQLPWTSSRPDGHAPIGVMGDHTHEAGEMMLSYRFMAMNMDGNRDGTEEIPAEDVLSPSGYGFPVTPLEMRMYMHVIGVMYAPSDRLTLMAMLPYVRSDMDHLTRAGGRFTTEASGLGDISLGGLLQLFNRDRRQLHLNLRIGIPSGSIDEEDVTPASGGAEVRLPYPMQIGSGTSDLLPGATYLGQTDNHSWGAQLKGTIRLGENEYEYVLGDRLLGTVWAAQRWSDWWSGSIRVQAQGWGDVQGADPLLDPAMVPTADPELRSGRRVDLLLGTNFEVAQGQLAGNRIALELGVPAWESLDGPQLETDWTVVLGWQYAFELQ
jgi:hypothetical protein